MNYAKLKNLVSKKSLGNSDKSQHYFQLFYFERILDRISKSKYQGQIILKGGLLLTSIIGDDERTTKDMDATLKSTPLTEKVVKKIFTEILNMDIKDGVIFKLITVKIITLSKKYQGFKLNILAQLENNRTYLSIDLTTGDIITPKEIKYYYKSIYDDSKIPIMAYNLESILAEKIHTIISNGVLNTRLKDYYDVYILMNKKINEIDKSNLKQAIHNTFNMRKTNIDLNEFKMIIQELETDENIQKRWLVYQSKNTYAQNIEYEKVMNAIKELINVLIS